MTVSVQLWPHELHALSIQMRCRGTSSLLIEDSLAVLETAARSGIAHTIAIRRPDSTQGRREISGFAAVDGVADLI